MSDPKILQLQKDLLTLGFDPGKLDGLMGPKTRAALLDYVGGIGLDAGSVLNDPTRLHQEAEAKRATLALLPPVVPAGYLDLSERCTNTAWRKKDRPWSEITGVTLHQTGCPMAENLERWLDLKAHYGVTYSGQLYRVHRETDFGWHAQGLSHHEIGIEIAGLFLGVESDPKTRPGAPKSWATQSITPAQVTATKDLIRYLVALVKYHGGALTEIHAHRQGAPKDDPKAGRKPDPGSKVWQEVALPLMAELGLSDGGPGWTLGKGEPIPEAWDSSRVGIKY